MKTYKNLYPQIHDFANLMLAWRKARRGKRYTPAAAAFERELDVELTGLHRELLEESYTPGPYRSFTIHEPKRRKISAAPFRDRVAHHALCNVIEPLFERQFIYDSYANRVGKGTHKALDRCTHFMRRNGYVLQCDIEQFFPAIDHQILKRILARTIADETTMRLCEKIIDSGRGVLSDQYTQRWFPGDDLLAATRETGLPIGNLTSQFWANAYLNELDQFVKHKLRCKGCLRFVDDFLIFSNNKRTLYHWRSEIIHFLQSLRLTIHEKRAQPRPVEQGIPFLGFTVYPDYRRLKRKKGIRYRRHLHRLYGQYQRGEIGREELNASVQSWIGHAKHGDTWGLRGKLFRNVVL